MKNVLITGGAGYIGSHTVLELLKREYNVYVVDNLYKGYKEFVLGGKFFKGNVGNKSLMRKILKDCKIDAVMHFAADSIVPESVTNPLKYFNNNVVETINLLNCLIECGIKYFIFSSTAAVYGEPEDIPIKEDAPTNPTNTYGETKLVIENALKRFDSAYGLKYVSLRYFNAAGADESAKIGEKHNPETHLIPIVLKVALGVLEEVQVFGTDYNTPDGTCIRDYIHVTDLANAHILALESLRDGMKSEVFNLGNGDGYSVYEVIEVAKEVTKMPIKIRNCGRREGDPERLIASSEKINKVLGWYPKYCSLKDIIYTAWNWHRKNL